MKTSRHICYVICFAAIASLSAQTEIGIAPGESEHIVREHSISILPISDVFIEIQGADSGFVGAEIDSFRVIQGSLKVKTNYTLSVSNVAPIGELNIKVVVTYSAEGTLTQNISEDFLINTSVQPSIVAEFSANPVTGSVPLVVNFTNESFGDIIGYSWDFGDGSSSNEMNPQHTYQNEGLYSVSLIAFNFNVQNKKTKEDFINAGNVSSLAEIKNKPDKTLLGQNYPNPFNPQTTITYYLPAKQHIEIALYDITGKRVASLFDDIQNAGEHSLLLHAENLSSGIYFYTLKSVNFTETKKLIINK